MAPNLGFVPSTPTGGTPAPAGGSQQPTPNLGFVPSAPNSGSTTATSPSGQESPGFLQSAAQSIAKPFLQFARLPAGLIDQGVGAITGNKGLQQQGADAASNMPFDFGYLGSVDAPGYDDQGKPLSLARATGQAVGAGLQVAPWFVGVGEAKAPLEAVAASNAARAAAPVTTAVKAIGTAAAAGAGIGASQGLGSTLESQSESGNFNAGQLGSATVGGAIAGATTAGILSSAGQLGGAILDSLASNSAATRLEDQAGRLKSLGNVIADSKTNPIETITDMMKASKDPLLTVVDGSVKTDALENAIGIGQSAINKQATEIVDNMPGTVNLGEFQTAVEDAIKNNSTIRGSGGVTSALSKVQSMFEDYVKSYGPQPASGLDSVNALARDLFDTASGDEGLAAKDVEVPYKVINEIRTSMNRFFDPETVDVERTIGNIAREILYDADTGSPELKDLMANYGELSDAQTFAEKLRDTKVKGGRLGKYLADMTGAGIGSAVGAPLGPFGVGLGGAAGGIVTDKVMNALQNSYFNPMLAQPASTLSRFVGTPAVQGAASLGQQGLIRAFTPQPTNGGTQPTQ